MSLAAYAAFRPLPKGEVTRCAAALRITLMLLFSLCVSLPARADPLPSGTTFLTDTLKTQQADEAANPGMLWVSEGARLWELSQGATNKACASCHGNARGSMKGIATRYPALDAKSGKLVNLEGRINLCRKTHQQAEPYAYESDELLSLTAFIARQSLGMPMHVDVTGAAAPFYEAGKAFFYQRQGQINLSCAMCHEKNAGRHLRSDTISYGLPNGYPAYRLEWQTLGSLHRRLRACSLGVRAIQFGYGSPEYLRLELFLAKRAEGVAIETPAIRK
jgi:L-cysteine S-thiosulfotransferase